MEIRGKKIGGLDAILVRNALRSFLDSETEPIFKGGRIIRKSNAITAAFLGSELALVESDAARLLKTLIEDGYVDKDNLTPTAFGMALIRAEDRPRLSLDEADRILEAFLRAVRKVNRRPGARIFVERVHVFGSYLRRQETVGDIDLLVHAPLPAEAEPEDFDELDDVTSMIRISDYLSFHDEFDVIAASVEKRQIYARGHAD